MPDYKQGKIYKIVCNVTGKVYIGSTIETLARRLAGHRTAYKTFKEGKSTNVTAYQIIEQGNYDIVLIDYYNCVDALNQQGILVLDDSSLYEDFNYPGSFKGHEGPSKVVENFIKHELDNFLAVGHNNCFSIPTYE